MTFNLSKRASEIKPVALMRLTEIDDPESLLEKYDENNIVIEQKYDGFKIQIIKSNTIKLYSRRGKDITANFPQLVDELKTLSDKTFVEGELVYIENGKQILEKVITLANSLPEKSLQKAKEFPGEAKIYLYDIIWYKGKLVANKTHEERRELLLKAVKPTKYIQISKQYPFSKWQSIINDSVKAGGEGIVLKLKDKPYIYKSISEKEPKPANIMWKFKGSGGKKESDDYVVYDYTSGSKGKFMVLFGQYYKGKLYHISELSNISAENEKIIKDKLKDGHFVLEIGFQERVPKGLRHQRLLRIRDDKKPKDATMNEFHIKHIDNFEVVKKAFFISKRQKISLG